MAPPVLYFNPNSGPCRGTWLAVQNLGVDVEIRNVNLFAKEQFRPEFIALNPQHVVPTLDDDGFVLWESKAISTYLANSRCPDSDWYPKDAKKRALVDSRLFFDATVLHPRLRAITRPVLYEGLTEIVDQKWRDIADAFALTEKFLQRSGGFLAGEKATLADCSALATIGTMVRLGASVEEFPKVKEWYEIKCRTLKGYKQHEEWVRMYVELIRSKLK